MIEWLIVGRSNNYGLTSDARLLADAIREAGGEPGYSRVRARGFKDWLTRKKLGSTVVHLERTFPRWLTGGDRHWLIPNQERFPHRQKLLLRRVDRVLAKTRHAQHIFSRLGVRTIYLGFTSHDRHDPAVKKDWNRFFHLAGGSTLKGTEDVLALWSVHPEWPELVLVQKAENAPGAVPANVKLMSGYLDDHGLKRLQNQCGIHLCPSRAEGWGHNIVEGLSTGSVVVTTDAPPMNELVDENCGIVVPYDGSEPRHLGTSFRVDRQALEAVIQSLIQMPETEKVRLGAAARRRFLSLDAAFRRRVRDVFAADVAGASSR
ncbi:MAG: glycosyltransferase family 4 protein [Rhizobiaceae bacterium]|nr:glycosyltransferase family 4 protein [Rhizobiaceae bacterium]